MATAATPASEVPGPRLPAIAQTLLGVLRPVDARLRMRKRHGRVFRTHDAIAGEVFHVAARDLVEQMFKWKPAQYRVGEPREVMEPVTGPTSVLLLDGERHLRMRKLMLPPFHGTAIEHYAELIEEITNREIDGWRAGQTIRTRTVAPSITMEVIIRAVSASATRGELPRSGATSRGCPRRTRCCCSCRRTSGRGARGAASCGCATASTGCSTTRSTSAAPTPAGPSARTSSRSCSPLATRRASR